MIFKCYEIKRYDVLLTHRKPYNLSPESWLLAPGIQYFIGCFYNHADIVLEVEGKLWVCGAIAGGFMPHTPLDKWLEQWPVRREFAVMRAKEFEPSRLRMRLHAIGGAGYDWNATLWDGFWSAFYRKFFGKPYKWNAKKMNQDKVNCSEAILFGFDRPDSFKGTPRDIYEDDFFVTILETRHLLDI